MSKIPVEFLYLNALRKSDRTNMFGATPFLERKFQLEKGEAKKVLMAWMQWANDNPDNLEK